MFRSGDCRAVCALVAGFYTSLAITSILFQKIQLDQFSTVAVIYDLRYWRDRISRRCMRDEILTRLGANPDIANRQAPAELDQPAFGEQRTRRRLLQEIDVQACRHGERLP